MSLVLRGELERVNSAGQVVAQLLAEAEDTAGDAAIRDRFNARVHEPREIRG
jgi:hypothetical protein